MRMMTLRIMKILIMLKMMFMMRRMATLMIILIQMMMVNTIIKMMMIVIMTIVKMTIIMMKNMKKPASQRYVDEWNEGGDGVQDWNVLKILIYMCEKHTEILN